jgi:hypothetical protein
VIIFWTAVDGDDGVVGLAGRQQLPVAGPGAFRGGLSLSVIFSAPFSAVATSRPFCPRCRGCRAGPGRRERVERQPEIDAEAGAQVEPALCPRIWCRRRLNAGSFGMDACKGNFPVSLDEASAGDGTVVPVAEETVDKRRGIRWVRPTVF